MNAFFSWFRLICFVQYKYNDEYLRQYDKQNQIWIENSTKGITFNVKQKHFVCKIKTKIRQQPNWTWFDSPNKKQNNWKHIYTFTLAHTKLVISFNTGWSPSLINTDQSALFSHIRHTYHDHIHDAHRITHLTFTCVAGTFVLAIHTIRLTKTQWNLWFSNIIIPILACEHAKKQLIVLYAFHFFGYPYFDIIYFLK